MNKYRLKTSFERTIIAENEEDAMEKLFITIQRNNETAENLFWDNMEITDLGEHEPEWDDI